MGALEPQETQMLVGFLEAQTQHQGSFADMGLRLVHWYRANADDVPSLITRLRGQQALPPLQPSDQRTLAFSLGWLHQRCEKLGVGPSPESDPDSWDLQDVGMDNERYWRSPSQSPGVIERVLTALRETLPSAG